MPETETMETETERTERMTLEIQEHARTEPIMRYFQFAHLPPHLARVSCWFAEIAVRAMTLPRNPERTVALRKLLEGKDAAVRAAMVTS